MLKDVKANEDEIKGGEERVGGRILRKRRKFHRSSFFERRRSTSSHEREELLHLRGLVHEAVRLVMPRPKVASSQEEEGGEEETASITGSGYETKLSRFPSAT